MQPILPVAIDVGPVASMLADLARLQLAGDLRLQDVVGAGRAAAEMALRRIAHGEAGAFCSSVFGCLRDLLAVLHRAGGMIGDGRGPSAPARGRSSVVEIFGDVLGQRRDRAAFSA